MNLRGMHGLGDNFYQRAVIRALGAGPHYLETPWPELYADLPVYPVKPVTKYRTQAMNIERYAGQWRIAPRHVGQAQRIGYDGKGNMLQSMCRSVGLLDNTPLCFDGPQVAPFDEGVPYVLIRPATVREEWRADARNPLPDYLDMAAHAAGRAGYRVISVASLVDGKEWALQPLPFAHVRYHSGQADLNDLLQLVAGASGCIGGVGWLLPAAVAYRRPMLALYGGWGKTNGPGYVLDPRMDCSRITQAVPDNFCMCSDPQHNCVKTINNIGELIDCFIQSLRG